MRLYWLIIPYTAISIVNIGALNANLRASFSDLDESPRHARQDFAMAVLFGLTPPMIILTPFFTAFYEDGLSYSYKPFPCTKDPEIWCDK